MPKADSVLSTPPTNTPISQVDATSRRRFLSQAAGVTAGGAVLALATIPPAPAAAAAPSAISAKNWQGRDHRGCRSDCGCNHHVAVAIFFDRAIGRCQAAVGRTPPNGGESFTPPVFWQLEFLVSSLGRSSGR
jgi:hypothetical protein